MKHTIRILGAVLALSMLLTGCSMWQPIVSRTPDVAATYGDGQSLSTGEYLAYLYENMNNIYTYYSQYGMDASTQKFTYGEGDNEKKDLSFMEYVALSTPDNIKTQIALDKLIADNNISFTEEEAKKFSALHDTMHSVEESVAAIQPDAFLPLGISNEHYIPVFEKLNLNFYTAYYGLYGKGGVQEVKDEELRKYFDENYLSFKSIEMQLVDSSNKELSKDEKKEKLDKLNEYLEICNKDGFEKAMDKYNKDNAAKDEEVEATKDEDNRQNMDKNNLDEKLVKAIETAIKDKKLTVGGKAAVIEYKNSSDTPCAIMIQLLDINKPAKVYEDAYEDLLYTLKYEEFEKLVEDLTAKVEIDFNEDVLEDCTPEKMMEDMEKASA